MKATNRAGFSNLAGAGNPRTVVSATAPNKPKLRDVWINTTTLGQSYWNGTQWQSIALGEGAIGTLITNDVQVINFKQNNTTKMAIGLIADKDNVTTPLIVFGAGDGNGNNRGYISKGTDGLSMYYIGDKNANEVAGLKLKKDGVYSTHKIIVEEGLGSQFILEATTWNAKLEKTGMKTILQTPSEAVGIVKENITSVNAEVIRGTYLSTANWEGGSGNYIYMTQQLMYFKESSTTKMAQGFLPDHTGTLIPMTVYGAGAGNDSAVNKGYISKDATGFNMFFVGTNNQAQGITIKSDGIYCTSALKLNTKLADAYIDSATTWVNKLQNMDTYGNMANNIVLGSTVKTHDTGNNRIVLDPVTGLAQYNSSNQKNGIFIDKGFSDLFVYYNNTALFQIYNSVTGISLKSFGGEILRYDGTTNYTIPQGDWNFSSATITGLVAKFG